MLPANSRPVIRPLLQPLGTGLPLPHCAPPTLVPPLMVPSLTHWSLSFQPYTTADLPGQTRRTTRPSVMPCAVQRAGLASKLLVQCAPKNHGTQTPSALDGQASLPSLHCNALPRLTLHHGPGTAALSSLPVGTYRPSASTWVPAGDGEESNQSVTTIARDPPALSVIS